MPRKRLRKKGTIDIRKYYNWNTKTVTDFIPAQSWYIQQHLDFVNGLYAKDQQVYNEVPLLSAGHKDSYPEVPQYSLSNKCGFTRLEWITRWKTYTSPCQVQCLTISHGTQFRTFVHGFKRHRFGYISPQEKYRFAVPSNNRSEDYPLNKIADLELIDLYHEVARKAETKESLLENSCQAYAPKLHILFDYFAKGSRRGFDS